MSAFQNILVQTNENTANIFRKVPAGVAKYLSR